MTQVIVLGWDALEFELIYEHGVERQFGSFNTTIDTYTNPVTETTHTKELWPSLITGQHPDDHGIHAVTDDDGIEWQNPLINTASTIANGVLPQSVLTYLGERLRERGAGLPIKSTDYYDKHGISTVFDGYESRPVSIPNYQTQLDRDIGLDANRDQVWADLSVDRMAANGYEPKLSLESVYDILGRELGARVGQTLTAIHQGHDIVWTWFGCLDTVGHMAPAIDAPIERDWYTVAASITDVVRAASPDDAIVLAVSDHGLIDGEHTNYATLCANSEAAIEEIDSIFDVREWIERQDPDAHTVARGIDSETMGDVEKQLQNLGYV